MQQAMATPSGTIVALPLKVGTGFGAISYLFDDRQMFLLFF
jgi:hypothetical protein